MSDELCPYCKWSKTASEKQLSLERQRSAILVDALENIRCRHNVPSPAAKYLIPQHVLELLDIADLAIKKYEEMKL